MSERRKKKAALPTKQQVLEFIRESPTPVGKREIARAFGISGGDRIALKAMLKEIATEGAVERGRGRRLSRPAALPETAVVEITGVDVDGEVMARPLYWRDDTPPPKILMAPERRGAPALAAGDRVLARLARSGDGLYEGRTIRQLAGVPQRVIGVYETIPGVGGRLAPTDRRVKTEYRIAANDVGGARPGELVLAEVLHTHRLGVLQARVVERLGQFGEARTISLISIHEHDIPTEFPRETLALAKAAGPVALGQRTDLRDVPLVTIDPEDARDHDDAVWAAPDDDPKNPGGFRLLVAIADVAHYVRAGDALDREAEKRGNSVYFPDRVVPMLPEEISNSLCSLRPREERPCLAVEMIVDGEGKKLRHRFIRALMRSAARLTYGQVQAARDGRPDDATGPLLDGVLAPLYGGYQALLAARLKRGTLDLDLPERQGDADRRQDRAHRAPGAARQPPAGGGIHDRGQRGGGRDPGGEAPALHVPRPRRPRSREVRGAAGVRGQPRAFAGAWPGDPAGRVRPPPRAGAAHALCGDDQRTGPAQPGPGRLQPGESRPFRTGAAAATATSRRRSGAMPTCSCIER